MRLGPLPLTVRASARLAHHSGLLHELVTFEMVSFVSLGRMITMATRYSQELPDDVVRVPINHELAITIAKDFGIHASPLNKWVSWPALSGANSLRVTRAENNVLR